MVYFIFFVLSGELDYIAKQTPKVIIFTLQNTFTDKVGRSMCLCITCQKLKSLETYYFVRLNMFKLHQVLFCFIGYFGYF